ncbi:MAG: XisI protein [Nostocaceae cyanobacterium]|nr:XisI protein [Nostocaceae cyanobacterium]
MDILDSYRQIIKNVLKKHLSIQYANGDIHLETIFDIEADKYLVMSLGWQQVKRIHCCFIHTNYA